MTPEQVTALVTALTALVVALAAIGREIHSLRLHINSKMDKLLEVTAASSRAQGVLDEKERLQGERSLDE